MKNMGSEKGLLTLGECFSLLHQVACVGFRQGTGRDIHDA